MARNRFSRGSGVYSCGCCGKRTRDTGLGEVDAQLCADCWDRAGLENEHSDTDGKHYTDRADSTRTLPIAGCPQCAGYASLDEAVAAEAASTKES